MHETDQSVTGRRSFVLTLLGVSAFPLLGCQDEETGAIGDGGSSADTSAGLDVTRNEESMKIHYLEIVTENVDAACKLYAAMHGVTFSEAELSLGGARTASLAEGGLLGIRAPMHSGEKPVSRAYVLVKDIEKAVAAAKGAGATIAVPPMQIPGYGTCAIYIYDGIEAGLWQL